MHGPNEGISEDTDEANSAVKIVGGNVFVELDPDHPGFKDEGYRDRRNEIAKIAMEWNDMSMDERRNTKIPHAPYSEDEDAVWAAIMERIRPVHEKYACRQYLDNARKLGLPDDKIPQLQEVSEKLHIMTGFRQEPVGGLVHPKTFHSALANKVFLSTQYIRHSSRPFYTPEPDVVHELVGHTAMLSVPEWAELNILFGEADMRTESEEAIKKLGTIYWFVLEFGACRENGEIKAVGPGLLSSFGEMEHACASGAGCGTNEACVCDPKIEYRTPDFEEMETHPYDVTKYQPILYVWDSFEEMYEKTKEFAIQWGTDDDPRKELHR
jgi:phenylalanine-4-hydroxylase